VQVAQVDGKGRAVEPFGFALRSLRNHASNLVRRPVAVYAGL